MNEREMIALLNAQLRQSCEREKSLLEQIERQSVQITHLSCQLEQQTVQLQQQAVQLQQLAKKWICKVLLFRNIETFD